MTRTSSVVGLKTWITFGLVFVLLVQVVGIVSAQKMASPPASPVAGAVDVPLAEIPIAPGSEQPDAIDDATLTLNLGGEVTTIDPQVTWFVIEIGIASKVYVPLLQLDEENRLADGGADAVTASEDGTVYTFHIREGMTYSDGQPVTAADYAYAIKRACSPEVAGNYSNILYAVEGCQEWREADPETDDVAALEAAFDQSVVAVDDQTLEVHLGFSAGYFPYVMTTWVTYPVREDLVGDDPDWWRNIENYVGNGPYKLVSHTEGQEWVFERNESYFRGVPGIQTLRYRIVTSAETEFLAYQQDELDMIGLSSALLPQVEGNPELNAQLQRSTAATTFYIGFNNEAAPFDDVLVRQAFSYAMNREQYIEQVLNGVNVPAGTLLHEGVPGYQTDFQQTYDPDLARQLLAEAGYPNGEGFPTLPLYYNSESAIAQQQATYWSQSFRQVLGVNVEPTPIDVAQLSSMIAERDPELLIWFNYWLEDYPHPQNWLSMVFGPGSTIEPRGWDNQEFDDLITEADKLPLEDALPLYSEADALLAEQAPVAFTIHGERLMLISPQIRGYVTYPTDIVDMRYQIEKIYLVEEE